MALAEHFEEVIGLIRARTIARAAPHPRVRYRVAPAEATGLPDASADLVIAAQALHWFDPARLHPELRASLDRGRCSPRSRTISAGWARGDEVVDRLYATSSGPTGRRSAPWGRRVPDAAVPVAGIVAPSLAIEESWTLDRSSGT